MKRSEDIREYLRGNRKGEAAHRLEREALSDPFLFEALEGLTETPGDPIDGLIRLDRQLNERTRSARKKRAWLYIAASVLVFALCGTLWLTYPVGTEIMHPGDSAVMLSSTQELVSDSTKQEVPSGVVDTMRGRDSLMQSGQPQMDVMEVEMNKEKSFLKKDVSMDLNDRKRSDVVEGIVTDSLGHPLPGVTVMLGKAGAGTVTNENGHYRINLGESKGSLTFSFVGMKTEGYGVSGGETLNVKLKVDQQDMEEVVVTGYRSIKKQEIVGSVTTIRGSGDTSAVVSDSKNMKSDVERFNRFAMEALNYPKGDLEKRNEGEIKLSFGTNKEKTPNRIRVSEGFSKACNQEIIRLLVEGPKWESLPSRKRVQVTVRFVIGKNGAKNKVTLFVDKVEN